MGESKGEDGPLIDGDGGWGRERAVGDQLRVQGPEAVVERQGWGRYARSMGR